MVDGAAACDLDFHTLSGNTESLLVIFSQYYQARVAITYRLSQAEFQASFPDRFVHNPGSPKHGEQKDGQSNGKTHFGGF